MRYIVDPARYASAAGTNLSASILLSRKDCLAEDFHGNRPKDRGNKQCISRLELEEKSEDTWVEDGES